MGIAKRRVNEGLNIRNRDHCIDIVVSRIIGPRRFRKAELELRHNGITERRMVAWNGAPVNLSSVFNLEESINVGISLDKKSGSNDVRLYYEYPRNRCYKHSIRRYYG